MREDVISINGGTSTNISRIGVVGINFKTAPISVREYLAKSITLERVEHLKEQTNGPELVLLSTCNRVEVYYYEDSHKLAKTVEGLFQQISLKEQFKFYHHKGYSAVAHLFQVAAGLDSLVVGETQILSQVRDAAKLSEKLCGPVLSKMFAKACENGRKLREENPEFTNGMKNSVSLSVLNLISKRYSKIKKPNLLLVGSGKMVRLAVASIDRSKLGRVDVAARRRVLNGISADSIVPLASIGQTIVEHKIDVVITATSAEEFILSPKDLGSNLSQDLLILDISVPRNVDPRIADLPRVTLLNLDDLKESMIDVEDSKIYSKLQVSISVRVNDFTNWLNEYNEVAPLLVALRKKAETIRLEEFENALSRMPNLTPNQRIVIEKMTERLVRRFLHEPTAKLKQLTREDDTIRAKQYTEALKELFSTEEEVPAALLAEEI